MFDALTLFGLASVTLMLVFYILDSRSHWYLLGFAFSCALTSLYGFLEGAWPFGLIEIVWVIVAMHRWIKRINSA